MEKIPGYRLAVFEGLAKSTLLCFITVINLSFVFNYDA